MNLNTFNDHLDRLGPAIDAWPADLRAQAQTLLAASPEAADALADARTLENLLQAMQEIRAPGHLAARISANAAAEDPWQRLMGWLAAAIWRPVLAAGLPLAFGFAIGMVQSPAATEDEYLAAELSLLAFTSSFEEPTYAE